MKTSEDVKKEDIQEIEKMLQDPKLNPHDKEWLEYKLRTLNGELDFSDLD